ncbi:hypothetical protein NtRootA4_21290 [Arthrobacter sp. NtRootA4]|nr:hypothetical protein NtRootA2_23490 [Arthrobacter sp. NtRootA2]BCW15150.1 hypothetical protein NtRootA4_21290 [Arthrobacter sp. NtRootA4]BCW23485.1 hypothetical protein NtRootC7_23520 [Arthrobacter sp. NtRootC7]BCW27753.1 hypothetical protein NtRootC45_23530 [Arthrobacter sp. NtRootC45]BCW32021.1 hypothetical protein NtRootD5_23520 [Arthrobacter sp. NtRootD5]
MRGRYRRKEALTADHQTPSDGAEGTKAPGVKQQREMGTKKPRPLEPCGRE